MNKRVKVWDLAVRVGHWTMGVLVLGAFLTSGEDESTPLHTRLGLALLGIVVFRFIWGLVGPRHARFSDFVRRPREVIAYAKEYVRGRGGTHLGHNPLGGVMVVAMLAVLATVTLTGVVVALGPEWSGPLSGFLSKRTAHGIKELHEAAAWVLPWMVGFHVAGVIVSSVLEKQNLVAGMITGRKRKDEHAPLVVEPSRAARAAGFLAALGMGAAVLLVLWRFLPSAEAEAAEPRPLLAEYVSEARASSASFAPSVERGKALYFEKGAKGDSCATCHTDDARAEGKSPVGKVIDPLAPGANPERFTDRKKSDRWFDRNCTQVLGRKCSAGEKADLLAWLSTL